MRRLRALPRPDRRWLGRWLVLPALLAGVVSANLDLTAPPIVGPERLSAVFLLDGQAYFGHLEDPLGSDTVTLRDVYYLQQASASTGLSVLVQRRGLELHNPADGMRIRRERILAIERVGPSSPLVGAIAADRAFSAAAR